METIDTTTDTLETVIFTNIIAKDVLEKAPTNLTEKSIENLVKRIVNN